MLVDGRGTSVGLGGTGVLSRTISSLKRSLLMREREAGWCGKPVASWLDLSDAVAGS